MTNEKNLDAPPDPNTLEISHLFVPCDNDKVYLILEKYFLFYLRYITINFTKNCVDRINTEVVLFKNNFSYIIC